MHKSKNWFPSPCPSLIVLETLPRVVLLADSSGGMSGGLPGWGGLGYHGGSGLSGESRNAFSAPYLGSCARPRPMQIQETNRSVSGTILCSTASHILLAHFAHGDKPLKHRRSERRMLGSYLCGAGSTDHQASLRPLSARPIEPWPGKVP